MVEKKRQEGGRAPADNRYLLFAALSAVFASLTAILGKIGISGVNSNLGTAIRTCVVLLMAWIVVFVMRKQGEAKRIPKKDLLFICLSGVATGASWLCYYRALQLGPASVVVPVDKLSIVATVLFSYLVFHEKLSKKEAAGLFLIVAGTLALLWA
jgi:transporter family protein